MLKRVLIRMAVAIAVITGVATLARAADPVTPPGSRISLVPPPGFTLSKTFSGFMNEPAKSSIVMMEMPPVAFAQLRDGMNAEGLARNGMRLVSTETIEGLPFPAAALRAEQRVGSDTFDKWLLYFDGGTFTGMVTISVARPAPAKLTDAVIRATLASVRASASSTIDPIAALPFSIEPAARFTHRAPLAGFGLLLKETPPPPEGKAEDVGFIITLLNDRRIPVTDPAALGEQQFLAMKAVTDKSILSRKPLKAAGLDGYEYLAEGRQSSGGTLFRYWVVVLYPPSQPVLILGFAPPDRFEQALPDFRAMVESFRSKL